jgi:Ca2+-binding EF-hand superfamily protein
MKQQRLSAFALLLAASCAGVPVDEFSHSDSNHLFDLLDSNRDGSLSPFEALDALLVISEEGELTRDNLGAFLSSYAEEELADRRDFFDICDSDLDGSLAVDELPDDFASMMLGLDANGDGTISWSEFRLTNIQNSEMMARGEGAGLYAEFVEEIGSPVKLEGSPLELIEELRMFDLDGDGIVTQQETVHVIREELAGATFEITGDSAIMRGVINVTTPPRVLELAFMNPEIQTIVLVNSPGSIDDVACTRAGRYIRQLGLNTHVPANGEVASGGVDLFLSGNNRSAEPGALFGIHSWARGPVPATELPKDHEDHLLYLSYYEEMGIPAKFYWRSIASAPPEGIHWMTEEEFELFDFFTDERSDLE